jgi:TolB-like protein
LSLFAELKRRNVFRVVAMYAVLSWLLLQIADVVFSFMGVADSAGRILIAYLAIGFIPVVLFSWVYEITPEGVKFESEVDRSNSITGHTAKKLDIAVIILLVLAIVLFGYQGLTSNSELANDSSAPSQTAEGTPTDKPSAGLALGVAVLPFQNLSEESANEFFAGGVHEDVLTHLSRIADLRVISRTSMLKLAGAGMEIRDIGQHLGVSHVLEGSVRRAGDRVRVTVQLIDALTDQHVWAENYDRTLDDIFAIQSEIALAIADRLKAELSPDVTAIMGEAPTTNTQAYDLYLQAREMRRVWGGEERFREVVPMLEEAVALDPDFLLALVDLASVYGRLAWFSPNDEEVQAAKALELTSLIRRRWPDRPESHWALGNYHYTVERDYEKALAEFQLTLQELPNDTELLISISSSYKRLNRSQEGLPIAQRALSLDPENSVINFEFAFALEQSGQIDRLIGHLENMQTRFPDDPYYRLDARLNYLGEREAYLKAALALPAVDRHQNFGNLPAFLLAADGKVDEAISSLQDSIQPTTSTSELANVHMNLARVLRVAGRIDESQVDAAKALDLWEKEFAAKGRLPGLGPRFTHALMARAAGLAGAAKAFHRHSERFELAEGRELLELFQANRVHALAMAAMGEADAAWAISRDPLQIRLPDPPWLLKLHPELKMYFGELPEYQALVAGLGDPQ